MSLSPEASETMPPPSALVFKLDPTAVTASKASIPIGTPDVLTGQPKRGRGRPPGSTNKRNPIGPGTARMSGSGGAVPNAATPVDKVEATKEQKKARAEEYATYINTELNDKLFLLISSMPGGPPASSFYKDNRVPPSVKTNPNFSELGNAVAIPADVAGSWGRLLAELSYTDAGKGVAKAAENNILTIAMAALTAIYSTYRYSQQLKPLLDQIKAVQEMQRMAAEEAANNGDSTGEQG